MNAIFIFSIFSVSILLQKQHVTEGSNINGPEIARKFFEFFENDSVGIPVIDLEDPMVLPPEASDFIEMKEGRVKGHSQIDVKYFDFDFNALGGWVDAFVPRIEIYGNYSWPGFFYSSEGYMNVTLFNVTIEANYTLEVNEINDLHISNFEVTIKKDAILHNFSGLIWEHETLVSSGAFEFLFDENVQMNVDWYRPIIIQEINSRIQDFIFTISTSKKEHQIYGGIRNAFTSTSTVEFLGQVVKFMNFDPLNLPERSTSLLGSEILVKDITLYGLSRVDEIKSLRFIYRNKKLYIESWMRYPSLEIHYGWGFRSGATMDMTLYEENQMRAVDIRLKLVVDLSLRQPPRIAQFQLKPESYDHPRGRSRSLWNRIRFFFSNIGRAVRRTIVNTLAQVLKMIFQDQLNKMNVKKEIMKFVE